MIHRKIVKAKTSGSRATRDLQPEFSERLPHGLNYGVLEYNETEGWCIVELWCSDHPVIREDIQKSMSDLEAFAKDSAVLEILQSHPKSPEILGSMGVGGLHSPKLIDKEKKLVEFEGRTGNYKRKIKRKRSDGLEEDYYVLDEG